MLPPKKSAGGKGSLWVILVLSISSSVSLQLVFATSQPTAPPSGDGSGSPDKQAVDDILQDTMLLLDALDQKLTSVQNRTPSALMRDNLRALELASEGRAEETPAAQWLSSTRELADDDALAAAASPVNEQADNLGPTSSASASSSNSNSNSSSNNNSKQARQLMDENQLASDSTERHIKFTLDLMRAVFAGHSSATPSPQPASSSSSSYSSPANKATPTSTSATATTNSIDSFLISPLSIQMVLMMMHLGARGQTRRELGNSLHLPAEKPSSNPIAQQSDAGSSSSSSSSSNKLKRRNQAAESNKPIRQPQRQPAAAGGANGAHEMFGSSVRSLLKDPSVLKALTSANQVFLQKNLPLAQQFEWAIKNYYASDIKLVDFQHQSANSNTNNGSSPLSSVDSGSGSMLNDSSSNSGGAEGKHQQVTADSNNNDVQQIVNEWIERQSRGKISNFLSSPVPVSTLLMAINVIYFKGDWQYKFDPADTETDAWFTQANGRQVKIPMMVNRLPLAFAHDASMRTSVIELPYKAQRLGLFLMLPDEISGIFNTMQMLNSTSFAQLISSMRKPSHHHHHQSTSASGSASGSAAALDQATNGNGINIRIPKFSIESSPRLSQILSQQLGLKTLFTPDTADLSGMFAPAGKRAHSGNRTLDGGEQPSVLPQVGLDELIHKAVLQVDEQGSVAAASSATIVERVGTFSGNYFEADHPFLVFLMDKQTGLVLFSGVFAGNSQQDSPAACKRGHNSQQPCKR